MEIKNETFQYKFTVPDHPTVRQVMEYFSAGIGLPLAVRHWECAKTLIQTWECETVPDFRKIDIDKETNPDIAFLLISAGREVVNFVNSLESVPKNS